MDEYFEGESRQVEMEDDDSFFGTSKQPKVKKPLVKASPPQKKPEIEEYFEGESRQVEIEDEEESFFGGLKVI